MTRPDLNLLFALEVLLEERSVAGAARRLRLSPSAMSRTLARLREATGDPLLVRSGRGVVPTPRAESLGAEVGRVLREAEAVLTPVAALDPTRLDRTFTLWTGDGFVETFGARLVEALRSAAPRARLRFLPRIGRDSAPLREGVVDLATGVIGKATSPELRTQLLFRDRLVAVIREGHQLARRRLTLEAYARAPHVEVVQHAPLGDVKSGPIDSALAAEGLEREVLAVVGGFSTALAFARNSDAIATVPERHTAELRAGMHTRALPFATPDIRVAMLWHPRRDADPAQRWLRQLLVTVCATPTNDRRDKAARPRA